MKKTAKMTVIQGPIAPSATCGVIYEVTLASGMIITNPAGFGDLTEYSNVLPTVIISDRGQVLARAQKLEECEPGANREQVHNALRLVATAKKS